MPAEIIDAQEFEQTKRWGGAMVGGQLTWGPTYAERQALKGGE